MNVFKISEYVKDNKLDTTRFEAAHAEIQAEMRTIKYATQDTFRTLLATDNYLQKYLPFQTQSIVSENFKAVLKDNIELLLKQKEVEH